MAQLVTLSTPDLTSAYADGPCCYAESLGTFAQALLASLRTTEQSHFEDGVIDAKSRLLDRYALCRAQASAPHTNAVGKRSHLCVTAMLDQAIDDIAQLARNTMPPARLGIRRDDDEFDLPQAYGIAYEPATPAHAPQPIGFDYPRQETS